MAKKVTLTPTQLQKPAIWLMFGLCALLLLNCGKNHYHKGTAFILDPGLKLFGATLIKEKDSYTIKSYFQSSIYFRTEYIYENLEIAIPRQFETGKEYDLATIQKLWYAKGGQGGQIETNQGQGIYKVLSLSETEIKVYIEAQLNNFRKKGHHSIPVQVKRSGILTAKTGYVLY